MAAAHKLVCDLETYSSVDLPSAGVARYVESPDFEILLLAYSTDDGPTTVIDLASGETIPGAVVEALRSDAYEKHAFNAVFEITCLQKIVGGIQPEQWRCDKVHAMYCGYPGSLEAAGKALGLPAEKQKLATGKALIRYFCSPCKPTKSNGGRTRNLPHHDPDRWRLFKEYNAQDVETEKEIERRLAAFPIPDALQQQWVTDTKINDRGVAIDAGMVEGALAIGQQTTEALMREAREITGLENPNSVGQMLGWLEEHGVSLANLQKETVADALKGGIADGDAQRALEIRQELGKTSTKKYDAIEDCVCNDGRVRGLLQFYGANRTGRWAGRLVQVQNLPRTYIKQLDLARQCVTAHNADALRAIFGSIPDTLSQLIRTAFIAEPGKVLIDADFSAIEARVIAWLAGEEWRLDAFREGKDIYCESASHIYGVPVVKHGENGHLRAKGKVAELSCGFGGSVGAMRRMGGSDLNMTDDELQQIVNDWRAASPKIVKLWYDLQDAAISAINGTPRTTHGLTFAREYNAHTGQSFLTITLPSRRKLFYLEPKIGENRWGGPSITYLGVDQTTKQWCRIETYGGKITENCLAWDTLVLTDHGAKPISSVTEDDKVWDGVEWVEHEGRINKGLQRTIDVNGVRLTPEHKVLTTEGWKRADEAGRLDWAQVQQPDSYPEGAERQAWKAPLGMQVRLWYGNDLRGGGPETREPLLLRMPAEQTNLGEEQDPRNEQTPSVGGLALDEAALHGPESQGVEELRRARNHGVRQMGGELRGVLGGHGVDVPARAGDRPDRQQPRIRAGELPLDDTEGQRKEPQDEHPRNDGVRNDDGLGARRADGHRRDDTALPDPARLAGSGAHDTTEREEQVYDLRNCGPRHRFTVVAANGKLRIVSNCVQATARDCLAVAIERVAAAGLPVVFHIHDEIVIEAPRFGTDEEMLAKVARLMTIPIPWAPGLPLAADGWVGGYFRKD